MENLTYLRSDSDGIVWIADDAVMRKEIYYFVGFFPLDLIQIKL